MSDDERNIAWEMEQRLKKFDEQRPNREAQAERDKERAEEQKVYNASLDVKAKEYEERVKRRKERAELGLPEEDDKTFLEEINEPSETWHKVQEELKSAREKLQAKDGFVEDEKPAEKRKLNTGLKITKEKEIA